MLFINNPFETVVEAVKELYPGTEALIQFNPNLRGEEFGECGCTTFPDDGSIPLVDISTNIPFEAMVEILGHELAHVVEGAAVEHGDRWIETFEKICQKFNEINEGRGRQSNE